jgi:AcrR family transcriptional regulator
LNPAEGRRSKAERTRAQILQAAELRFAELGFGDTRLEDVGEDVGIGRSAILYHFKDKQQLYLAVLDDLFGGLLGELRAELTRDAPLPERLEAAVSIWVDYVGRRSAAARIILRESANASVQIRAQLRAQAEPFLQLLTRIFEEGKRSGVFLPIRSDPFHLVSAVLGATVFHVAALPALVGDLPYDPLAPEELESHKQDVLKITRRLLGIGGLRPIEARQASRGPSSPPQPSGRAHDTSESEETRRGR